MIIAGLMSSIKFKALLLLLVLQFAISKAVQSQPYICEVNIVSFMPEVSYANHLIWSEPFEAVDIELQVTVMSKEYEGDFYSNITQMCKDLGLLIAWNRIYSKNWFEIDERLLDYRLIL